MKITLGNKHGLVLIISLWILAITSLLCIGLAHRVVINLKLAKFQKDRMQCLYVAKAAIRKAINVLSEDETPDIDMLNELWSRGYDEESGADGSIFKEVEVGEGIFTISYDYGDINSEPEVYFYGMSDEDRKININRADEKLLESLFDLIGFEDAKPLAENIIYWRGDAPQGPEDPYYETSEIPYPARKAPFKTMEELSLVKGFRENPELIEECERFFTVYTEDNLININTAPWQILKAVFISLGADEAEGVGSEFSDRLAYYIIDIRDGVDNEDATKDDEPIINTIYLKTKLLEEFRDKERNWINDHFGEFPFTVKSNLFRIEVSAKLNTSKIRKKVTAIIDRSEELSKIRYWHEE